jgi:hypothetical protein
MRWARSGLLLLIGCGQDPVSVVAPSVESKFPWYFCIHGSEVGYDLEKDKKRFTVTPKGIAAVEKGAVVEA